MSATERIGRFDILGPLGAGGMGVVYRARDTRTGEVVALKVLHGLLESAGSDAYRRFEREVRALEVLRHEHIVSLRSGLARDRNRSFYAMELCEGTDLARLLRARGRLRPAEAAAAALLVLDALATAHATGIVHRDIKPQNVLIGRGGALKVVDFGIARMLETTGLTVTGHTIGTPAYTAPEVAEGGRADARSDVYSVGILLYAMLAGRPPFAAESALAVLRMHAESEPPPLSDRTPEVPPALEAVVAHALQKTPEDRYASAEAMADALRGTGLVAGAFEARGLLAALDPGGEETPAAAEAGRPGAALADAATAPTLRAAPVGRPGRRLASALVIAAAIGGGVWVWSPWTRPDPERAASDGRRVRVILRAGGEARGTLVGIDASSVRVRTEDGRSTTVPLGEVAEIRYE